MTITEPLRLLYYFVWYPFYVGGECRLHLRLLTVILLEEMAFKGLSAAVQCAVLSAVYYTVLHTTQYAVLRTVQYAVQCSAVQCTVLFDVLWSVQCSVQCTQALGNVKNTGHVCFHKVSVMHHTLSMAEKVRFYEHLFDTCNKFINILIATSNKYNSCHM